MGLMKFIKSQCLKVIDWNDMTKNTIAYRFQVPDRYEIMKNSMLVVRESQLAIFVKEGRLADIFQPGTYKLDDIKNIPLFSKLSNWKYAFESKWKGEVYFINTTQFTDRKWGTTNPVMMRDADFGVIRIRGYGIYSFQASDPEKLLKELFGTKPLLTTEDIEGHLKKAIISKLTDAIAESRIPALDLAMHYDELSEYAEKKLAPTFIELGFTLRSFYIENLSLPPEVEKTLDTRTQMGVLGDKMGTFTQFQAAHAMRDAASNPSGGLAGAGVGLGAGVGIGKVFADAFGSVKDEPQKKTVFCPKCKASVAENAKFCPGCGEKMAAEKKCGKCGADVKANAKFCPECGEKMGTSSCAKCGHELKSGAKFCPECGEKV